MSQTALIPSLLAPFPPQVPFSPDRSFSQKTFEPITLGLAQLPNPSSLTRVQLSNPSQRAKQTGHFLHSLAPPPPLPPPPPPPPPTCSYLSLPLHPTRCRKPSQRPRTRHRGRRRTLARVLQTLPPDHPSRTHGPCGFERGRAALEV